MFSLVRNARKLAIKATLGALVAGAVLTPTTVTVPKAHAHEHVYSVPGAQFWVRKNGQITTCSVGLPFRYNGVKGGGFVTSAHCFLTIGSNYVTGVYGTNGRKVGDLAMIGGETVADNGRRGRIDFAIVHLYDTLGTSGWGVDYENMPIEHALRGERICKVGHTTGHTCGSVVEGMAAMSNDQKELYLNHRISNTMIVSRPIMYDHGDSGGLVYDPQRHVILGIVSGGSNTLNACFTFALDKITRYIPH